MSELRITLKVAGILATFTRAPAKRRYGMELMKLTELPSGSLYPVLRRLEQDGWLTSEREVMNPDAKGRPSRRYYTMVPERVQDARAAVKAAKKQLTA